MITPVYDPGHLDSVDRDGVVDVGCIVPGGYTEASLASDWCVGAVEVLRHRDWPYAITSLYDEEVTSYPERGEMVRILAERGDQPVVICVHVNAMPPGSPEVQGLMIFVRRDDPWSGAIAEAAADLVPDGHELARPRDRRVYRVHAQSEKWTRAAWSILRCYPCPAILVEVGFATNASDAAYMLSESGRLWISAYLAQIAGRAEQILQARGEEDA